MKKTSILFAFIVLAVVVHAQAPQKMSYQAVVRHSNGQLIVNQQIGMRMLVHSSTHSLLMFPICRRVSIFCG